MIVFDLAGSMLLDYCVRRSVAEHRLNHMNAATLLEHQGSRYVALMLQECKDERYLLTCWYIVVVYVRLTRTDWAYFSFFVLGVRSMGMGSAKYDYICTSFYYGVCRY